jgi:hypothetical protein
MGKYQEEAHGGSGHEASFIKSFEIFLLELSNPFASPV